MDLSGQHLLSIKELYNSRKKKKRLHSSIFISRLTPLSHKAGSTFARFISLPQIQTTANKMISRQGKIKIISN